ncbi:hypothetical protein MXB_1266 [Myxobolus squamalis]|nr:hypothetical protein MXB_1266 [Myxobolus squamalis]
MIQKIILKDIIEDLERDF